MLICLCKKLFYASVRCMNVWENCDFFARSNSFDMSTFISLYVKYSYITCRIKLNEGRQVSFLTKSKLNPKKFDRKKKFEAMEKQKTGKKE